MDKIIWFRWNLPVDSTSSNTNDMFINLLLDWFPLLRKFSFFQRITNYSSEIHSFFGVKLSRISWFDSHHIFKWCKNLSNESKYLLQSSLISIYFSLTDEHRNAKKITNTEYFMLNCLPEKQWNFLKFEIHYKIFIPFTLSVFQSLLCTTFIYNLLPIADILDLGNEWWNLSKNRDILILFSENKCSFEQKTETQVSYHIHI